MRDSLLDHLRALAERVALALEGQSVVRSGSSGYLNSRFDRFLNHVFAGEGVALGEAESALEGRPGFVWLGAADAGVRRPAGPSQAVTIPLRPG